MPLYDYDCAACGERFEILRGVHADPPEACPLCGGGPIKKAFATPAIHFKGSGWAKKERRATSSPGASKAAGESSTSKDGESSTKDGDSASKDGGSADKAASSDTGKAGSSSSSETPAKAVSTTSEAGASSARPGKAD